MSQSIMALRARAVDNLTDAYQRNIEWFAALPPVDQEEEVNSITLAYTTAIRRLAFSQDPDAFLPAEIREMADPDSTAAWFCIRNLTVTV